MVELVLVVIIISVLGAAILPRFVGRAEQAKVARAKADISSIGLALDLYELDAGSYPSDLPALTQRDPPAGTEAQQWNGPYLKKGLPEDPWGNPYSYNPQSQHQQDYDLFSYGPDGKPGNDDITNWE